MNTYMRYFDNQADSIVDMRLTEVKPVGDAEHHYECTVYFRDRTNNIAGRINSVIAHGATLPIELPETVFNMYDDGVFEPISMDEFALL